MLFKVKCKFLRSNQKFFRFVQRSMVLGQTKFFFYISTLKKIGFLFQEKNILYLGRSTLSELQANLTFDFPYQVKLPYGARSKDLKTSTALVLAQIHNKVIRPRYQVLNCQVEIPQVESPRNSDKLGQFTYTFTSIIYLGFQKSNYQESFSNYQVI